MTTDAQLTQAHFSALLARRNAVITGSHVVYTSGLHGRDYVNKDAVYPYVNDITAVCDEIASQFVDAHPEAVIGPAVGGTILSQRTAEELQRFTGIEVLSVYADKEGEEPNTRFVIKRGYDKLIRGKRLLVVEDVLTTGGSVLKVVRAARELGCDIVGVGALCNRGGITAEQLDVPRLYALVNVSLETWTEAECPMCQANEPINTDVGKGKEFLARKAEAR